MGSGDATYFIDENTIIQGNTQNSSFATGSKAAELAGSSLSETNANSLLNQSVTNFGNTGVDSVDNGRNSFKGMYEFNQNTAMNDVHNQAANINTEQANRTILDDAYDKAKEITSSTGDFLGQVGSDFVNGLTTKDSVMTTDQNGKSDFTRTLTKALGRALQQKVNQRISARIGDISGYTGSGNENQKSDGSSPSGFNSQWKKYKNQSYEDIMKKNAEKYQKYNKV